MSNYCWPSNYLGYLDDYYSVLRFLHFYNSQKDFFKKYKISDTLIEKTCDCPFEKIVGSFFYHYVTSRLNVNNTLSSLIDGATQSLSIYSNYFDYENKSSVQQILTNVLQFLNVPKKGIKILIDSTLFNKNTKKLVKFLQNYTEVDNKIKALTLLFILKK